MGTFVIGIVLKFGVGIGTVPEGPQQALSHIMCAFLCGTVTLLHIIILKVSALCSLQMPVRSVSHRVIHV